MRRLVGLAYLVLASVAFCAAQNGAKDATLQVELRIMGKSVLPFDSGKQNAVISGIASVLGNAVSVSDITLTVLKTYDSITASGHRRLLQQAASYPAVDSQVKIRTSTAMASSQATTLSQATNVTYGLVSAVGAQGSDVQNGQSTAPAESPVPSSPSPTEPAIVSPPSSPPPAEQSQSPPKPAAAPIQSDMAPAKAPAPLDSGVGALNAAASNAKHSSLSGGAIAGIAVGGAAIAAIAVALAIFSMRRQTAIKSRRLTAGKPGFLEGTSSNIVAYTSSAGPGSSSGAGAVATSDDKQELGLATEKIEVR